ncbi:hypothetical protein D3C81_1689120 [compost metagenome]
MVQLHSKRFQFGDILNDGHRADDFFGMAFLNRRSTGKINMIVRFDQIGHLDLAFKRLLDPGGDRLDRDAAEHVIQLAQQQILASQLLRLLAVRPV